MIPDRYLWAMRFNNSPWEILDDMNPATTWNPSPPIEMAAGGNGGLYRSLRPPYIGLEGNTTVDLEFDDNCHKGITVDMPTATRFLDAHHHQYTHPDPHTGLQPVFPGWIQFPELCYSALEHHQ